MPPCFQGVEDPVFEKFIEIIDIHKLREDMGEKTVAIDAFEGKNLVLVDEGHRGASGKETGWWMQARNRLCEHGFSFEYSAMFGQAMKASGNRKLEQDYANLSYSITLTDIFIGTALERLSDPQFGR